jgi:hypothetical protein
MSKVRTVSRFALFLFVAAFATTAISGEARKPSATVTIESRSDINRVCAPALVRLPGSDQMSSRIKPPFL